MLGKSTIKYIQSLQHKKFRDEYDVFVAEGPKVVGGFLTAGQFKVRDIYAVKEWMNEMSNSIQRAYAERVHIVEPFELEKIAAYTTANQVVATFEKRKMLLDPDLKSKLTLVLDDIQDPGNLGTMIRTADWFGIENIVCSFATADMYNSKVVQSTMASLGNVNIIYTDIVKWIDEHKEIKAIATTLKGTPLSNCMEQEGMLIIGNESKGVSEEIISRTQLQITIPKYGNAESLNAAVATGIILSHLKQ